MPNSDGDKELQRESFRRANFFRGNLQPSCGSPLKPDPKVIVAHGTPHLFTISFPVFGQLNDYYSPCVMLTASIQIQKIDFFFSKKNADNWTLQLHKTI